KCYASYIRWKLLPVSEAVVRCVTSLQVNTAVSWEGEVSGGGPAVVPPIHQDCVDSAGPDCGLRVRTRGYRSSSTNWTAGRGGCLFLSAEPWLYHGGP